MKTTEVKLTREDRIRMARHETKMAAEIKDWRITNKYNRQQREAARKLLAGDGYIEATQADAHKIDSNIEEMVTVVKRDASGNVSTGRERANHTVKIWGYMWNDAWKRISLTAF